MDRDYGDLRTKCDCADHDISHEEAQINSELLAFLRHRVATRYYNHPLVIDRIARAIHAGDTAT